MEFASIAAMCASADPVMTLFNKFKFIIQIAQLRNLWRYHNSLPMSRPCVASIVIGGIGVYKLSGDWAPAIFRSQDR